MIVNALLRNEILGLARLGWILEKLGRSSRQYFYVDDSRIKRTIADADDPSDTFYVGDGYDDAHEAGDGLFYYSNDLLEIQSDTDPSSHSYMCTGLRFPTVNIAIGSTVSAASVTVYCADYQLMNARIYGNDVDNAVNFLSDQNIISRTRTSAYVTWSATLTLGTWETKTGLEGIIQEIIDRAGWSSGNAVVLLFIAIVAATKRCNLYSYDKSSTYKARLAITWTIPGWTGKVSGVTNPAKVMGVAATNINKVKGVT